MAGFLFPADQLKFKKPPLSYEDLAKLLESRGLVIPDRAVLLHRLQTVGFYRLCAYWHTFKQPDSTFAPGTSFDTVWMRYRFDRRLRLIVMDGIERLEVALRTALVHELAMRHGAFCHLERTIFRYVDAARHTKFVDEMQAEAHRSTEVFVLHFKATYDEFPNLPIWAAAETMTFGALFTLFKMSDKAVQVAVARRFGVSGNVFTSWLTTFNYVRNICAHHARLWNRELALKPMIPDAKNDMRWHTPKMILNYRVFVVLSMLQHCMRLTAPQSEWKDRLFRVFDDFPDVPTVQMGIPADWRDYPLWK